MQLSLCAILFTVATCQQQQDQQQNQQQNQQQQQQQDQQQQQQDQGGFGVQPGAWNGSLLDNLNNQFQLRNVSLLFRSYCGQEIQRVLNNRTGNITFFAPSDTSFGQYLNMSGQMGAAEFNCSTQGTNGSEIAQYCDPNNWPVSLQNVSFYNVSACSPLILQYHVVPEQVLNLTQQQQQQQGGYGQGQDQSGVGLFKRFQRQFGSQQRLQQTSQNVTTLNVTVLETMLNDTRFVNLPQNSSQVLILNQTDSGFYLRHGAWPESKVRVNESISGVNGIAYIIDGPLFPPMNLTRSLEMLNMTNFSNAVQQISGQQQQQGNQSQGQFRQMAACQQGMAERLQNRQRQVQDRFRFGGIGGVGSSQGQQQQQGLDQMQGITVFAPLESILQNGTNFNATAYIIPNQVIYNNGTLNQTSFQAMDGSTLNITVGSNYTMQVGNASVVESNILLSNGVLHIIDSIISNNTASA